MIKEENLSKNWQINVFTECIKKSPLINRLKIQKKITMMLEISNYLGLY